MVQRGERRGESRPLSGPVEPTAAVEFRPVAQRGEAIVGGVWARRQRVNRDVSLPLGHQRLEEHGNFDNLRRAAAHQHGGYRGPLFNDSDVYKWLEAVAWEQGRRPAADLAAQQSSTTALVAAAQSEDGYLNSYIQLTGGDRYGDLASGHELYCAGHLFQAAVAQHRAGGDDALLGVATAFADEVVSVFGPGGRDGICGHPEIEMALVELARTTGRRKYLDMAATFVDRRGHQMLPVRAKFTSSYFQDDVPVREATTVAGHAVRALYLNAGATDVMVETGDDSLGKALWAQWLATVTTKSYITGGVGARWDGESFGDPYELPPDRAYAETCAAIAAVQWSWRMLLATGDAAFADHIERTLYNAVICGVSDDGGSFAYVNPLHVRNGSAAASTRSPVLGRQPWFGTACCPANVMRTIASLQHYLLTSSDRGLQAHQYAPGRLVGPVAGGEAELVVGTEYPWQGDIEIEVRATPDAPWELALRLPAWCSDPHLSVNGTPTVAPLEPGGYAPISRRWTVGDKVTLSLPMPVRRTYASPRVDAVRGCTALERGPIVYCVEQTEVPGDIDVDDLTLVANSPIRDVPSDLFGGVRLLELSCAGASRTEDGTLYGAAAGVDGSTATLGVRAVPYYAWANREVGPMRVWLPLAER